MASNDRLEQLLENQIAAQNRTTHAVRALATYVLYQVGWALLGGVVIGLALVNEDPGIAGAFMFIGGLVIIIGFFHAYTVAMGELNQSIVGPRAVTTSNSAKAEDVTPAEIADGSGVTEDDWVNAQRFLDWRQMKAWEKAGKPALASWFAEDKPDFNDWLSRQS